MSGFIYVLLGSILFPIVDVFKKKATNKFDIKIIFWGVVTFALPIYGFVLLYNGLPAIDSSFWWLIAVNTPLLIFTNILLIKDEKIAPISTTLPLLSFTPVFLIFTSFILLGELPNKFGIIGIFLVVLGALLLKGERIRHGFSKNLYSIFKRRESQYILIIAFIWAFNSNLIKLAIQASSVWFYLFVTAGIEALIMSIWLASKHRAHLKKVVAKNYRSTLLIIFAALITALADILFLTGMEKIFVSYAIAIKRAFLIIGCLTLGATVFHEKNIKYRLAGAGIMVAGIIFILILH